MDANKVIPENLELSANFQKFTSLKEDRDQSQSSVRRAVIGRGLFL